MRTPSICFVGVVAAVLHCSASTLDAKLTAYAQRELVKLDAALVHWSESGPSTYSLRFDRDCFCGYGISPALIEIVDGQIASVSIDEPDDLVTHMIGRGQLELIDCWSEYDYTVDDLFDLIEDHLRRDYRVDFVFDESLGYPRRIWVSSGAIDTDSKLTVELVAPPPSAIPPNR